MVSVGAIVRFLMLSVCLVPFTSTQQTAGALAPIVPLAPGGPMNEAPAPVNEEDDERETDGKERLSAHAKHRPATRTQIGSLPPAHASHPSRLYSVRTTPPTAGDPFRNGLGSPDRCEPRASFGARPRPAVGARAPASTSTFRSRALFAPATDHHGFNDTRGYRWKTH